MKSTKMIRAAKLSYTLLSALLLIFGVMMILRPDFSLAIISRIVGLGLIAYGIVRIVGYYSRDLYRLAFQHDLALGILTFAIGLLVLFKPNWTEALISLTLGIAIVTDGLFKIQTALDARRFGLNSWWLIMILAVITGGIGVALIVAPVNSMLILTRLLGASFAAEGLLNLCVAIFAIKIITHQQPDIIEGETL